MYLFQINNYKFLKIFKYIFPPVKKIHGGILHFLRNAGVTVFFFLHFNKNPCTLTDFIGIYSQNKKNETHIQARSKLCPILSQKI